MANKRYYLRICIPMTIFTLFTFLFPIISPSGIVEYRQFDVDSSPKDLVWCGPAKETVMVLTELNSVYKSEDKGFSWKRMNDIFTNLGKEELEENENEIGKVSRIIQSPVDKSLMIFLGTHGINWIVEDCGRKVKALNHGRKIKEFVFHPTERNWGLASAFTLCEDFVNTPCKIYKELFVTKDLGEHWDLLGGYIVHFGWGAFDESHIAAGIPKERILVSFEPRGKGDQQTHGWNYKVDFMYSDDFFKTKRIGAHKGNKFLLTKSYLFVAQVLDQEIQEVVLLGASATEKYYNFVPIETNQKAFKEHSYTFLDTTENSVFLHINHFGEVSRWGHIYVSDIQGLKYSLSMKYNLRSWDNQCDFEKINSLEGIYIGNVISSKYMKDSEQEMEEKEIEKTEEMEDESSTHKSQPKESYNDFIKTLITFNKGGDWKKIKAPEKDSNGNPYDCDNYCYLNLFGISSDYPPFYSVESAAGIIIGNGNVGRYLNHEEDISTFLSRDGGLTWFEIKKGSHIYEIGDHGALIVIADDHNPTNSVFYTWDEGLTWQEMKISQEKFNLKNIIIEPSSTSQHFIVYGEHSKGGTKKGVIIGLDFSSLHEPQCKNPDTPDASDSDYEKWSPNDGRAGRECLLGKKMAYVRRKREAQCYNGQDFERKIFVENCTCTEDDYECDMGYERPGPGEPCMRADHHDEEIIHKPPEVCHGYYTISRGYRKIPGNSCVNGAKFDPILLPCPYSGVFASLGVIFFIVILFVLIALVVLALTKNLNISQFLPQFLTKDDSGGLLGLGLGRNGSKQETYHNIDNGDEDNILFDEEKPENSEKEKNKPKKPTDEELHIQEDVDK